MVSDIVIDMETGRLDRDGALIIAAAVLMALLVIPSFASALEKDVCAVYFTGIGCPHCAKADPVVLQDMLNEYPNLVIIEYEIYQNQDNAPLIYNYNLKYSSGMGIPLLLFNRDDKIVGDIPIIQEGGQTIERLSSNGCPLQDGTSTDISDIDFSELPGNPTIWTKGRTLTPTGGGNGDMLKRLLTEDDLESVFSSGNFSLTDEKSMPLSGGQIAFEHAVSFGGGYFKWNGECPDILKDMNETCENTTSGYDTPRSIEEFTVIKILSLAAVDAVNPCALAVLTLMLIAILTYNPKIRKNVLLSGFAFTLSVFVMYIVYGLVIIRSFQIIQAITSIRLVLYNVLGVAAIILGILNLKDFLWYKPGGMMTEMPMRMRPMLKKIISGITSPRGAFIVGAFVTVFLLPCTIGPYVIAGGILSSLEIIQTLPWLIIYNVIFVIPMMAITLMVYFGTAKVEDVSGWKDKNIRYLHLVAGTMIVLLGIAMIMGWV